MRKIISYCTLNYAYYFFSINEKDVIISADLSKNGKLLLINTSFKLPKLHVWDLEAMEILYAFYGHTQEKFILRCAFGGQNDSLVSCGSEGSFYTKRKT